MATESSRGHRVALVAPCTVAVRDTPRSVQKTLLVLCLRVAGRPLTFMVAREF
jgi:hypothetical protein